MDTAASVPTEGAQIQGRTVRADVAAASCQFPTARVLLHRSLGLYVQALSDLLHDAVPRPAQQQDGPLPTEGSPPASQEATAENVEAQAQAQTLANLFAANRPGTESRADASGTTGIDTRVPSETPAAAARQIAEQLEATAQATAEPAGNRSFTCAAAAATVLANMALALLQLQDSTSAAAAAAVSKAAGSLIQHTEQQRRLQDVHFQQRSTRLQQVQQEGRGHEDEDSQQQSPTQEEETPASAFSILHQVRFVVLGQSCGISRFPSAPPAIV